MTLKKWAYLAEIGSAIAVVGVVALVIESASAKRQEFVNPEAESILVACREHSLSHMDERETCVRKMSEDLSLGDLDTRLVWEKLLINISKKPFTVNLGDHEQSLFQEGPSLIFGVIEDKRQFDKYIGNNRRQDQSSDVPGNSSVNDGLIGRAIEPAIRDRQQIGVREVRLGKGKTVSAVIREAVTRGFEQAGYRVIDPDVEPSAQGARIDIEIYRFWLWNEQLQTGVFGYGDVSFIGVIEVKIKAGTLPLPDSVSVNGRASLRGSSAARKGAWANTGNAVLKNLSAKVKEAVKVSKPNSSPESSDIFEKAEKCRDKGGVWINDICQIQID